jgi:hypothetical protein
MRKVSIISIIAIFLSSIGAASPADDPRDLPKYREKTKEVKAEPPHKEKNFLQEVHDAYKLVFYIEALKAKQEEVEKVKQQAVKPSVTLIPPVEQVYPTGSVWDRLAQCESGGNWAINTGNGYYGGLQFLDSTWDAMGTGYDRADHAPREVQIEAAQRLQAQAGWGQWPTCAAKLGL